jgi:hypothetical protein
MNHNRYVANVPPRVTGPQLRCFLDAAIEASRAIAGTTGSCITSCNMSEEGYVAFVEIRSPFEANIIEETLSGLIMEDHLLKVYKHF